MLLVGLGAATAFAVTRATEGTKVTTVTLTRTTAAGLPQAVATTRGRILAAAAAHDWAMLGRIADEHRPRYTFGPEVQGGPIALWKQLEAKGERPLETMVALLGLPYALYQGNYAWPFAYALPPEGLSPYELKLLSPRFDAQDVEAWKRFGSYFDWRLGIAPDGRWQYFVRGD